MKYYRYIVIYKKASGEVIYRYLTTLPKYEVGQITSMGWKVLDIKRLHKGRTMSDYEYITMITKKNPIKRIYEQLLHLYNELQLKHFANFVVIYTFIKIFVKL